MRDKARLARARQGVCINLAKIPSALKDCRKVANIVPGAPCDP